MTNNNYSTNKYISGHYFRIFILAAAALLLAAITCAYKPYAAVSQEAFEIQRYEMQAKVNKDHSFEIKKTVTVNLPSDRNDLKLVLAPDNSIITDISAEGQNYVTLVENGTRYINITSPKNLKAGIHVITIDYTLNELHERNELSDKFYLNVLLPEWRHPIGSIDIKLTLPEDFDYQDLQYYAGRFGIQDTGKKIKFKVDQKSGVVTLAGERIPENYGITVMADLPNGYWVDALDGSRFLYAGLGIIGAILAICFILWFIGGRDPKTGKIKQTHPVEGISPVEVGFIFDGKIRNRDIIALIIYLGTRGCLRISEYAPKRFQFTRLEEPKAEQKFIRNAYNILFEDVYEGRSIDLDEATPRLKRIMKAIELDIESGFSTSDMLPRTPVSKVFRVISLIIAGISAGLIPLLGAAYQYIAPSTAEIGLTSLTAVVALALTCYMYDREDTRDDNLQTAGTIGFGLGYVAIIGYEVVKLALLTNDYIVCIGIFAAYMLMMLLVLLMQARGKGNAELVAKYRALRKYIYRAKPKDVMDAFKEDKNYYYDIVPYAYLFLGLETWAKTFKWMGVPEPVWYSDDIEGHAITHAAHKDTTLDVARTIKSFARSAEARLDAMSRYNIHR